MSHDFQLQLIRKTLEDLGHAPVADLLAKRILAANASSNSQGSPNDSWGKSVAGDYAYPRSLSILSTLDDHIGDGDYDLALRVFESCNDEFDFANSRIQLTATQKALSIYLVHRFAFLEKIILKSFGQLQNVDAEGLIKFLQTDLTNAYNAVDWPTVTAETSSKLISALSRELEASLLLTLVMQTPDPANLELQLLTPKVSLTELNPAQDRLPLESAAFVNRLRNVLSHILHTILSSGSNDKALSSVPWSYHDIPSNCLDGLIRSATLYNLLRSLYYLPPRTEHYFTDNLPMSMVLPSPLNDVSRDDLPIHLLHTLTDHTDEVWFTKFSPLGRFLATGSLDGTCNIYDVQNGFSQIAELDATSEDQESVFVAGAHKPALDKKKGIIYFCWEPHERYIVTCCLDTVIRVWHVENITQSKRITRSMDDTKLTSLLCCFTLGESMRTWPCEFLPYKKSATPHFIVGSPDKVLKVFTIEGTEVLDFYSDADEWLTFLDEDAPLPSTQNLSGVAGSYIRSDPDVSASTGAGNDTAGNSASDESKSSAASLQQFNRINDFATTANGKVLITANNDKQVFFYRIPDLFDPAATTSRIALLSLNGRLTSCTVSADSRYMLLSIAPEELQLWDISPLEDFQKPFLKQKFVGQSQATYMVRSCFGYLNVAENKEELILSGSDDGNIYIWKLETGQLITRIRGHHGLCNSVDWNRFYKPTGQGKDYGMLWSSVGDDKLVKIWGPKTS